MSYPQSVMKGAFGGRFGKPQSGDWFPIARAGRIIRCCDCHLAHLFVSRVDARGTVWVAATRLKKVRGGGYVEDV